MAGRRHRCGGVGVSWSDHYSASLAALVRTRVEEARHGNARRARAAAVSGVLADPVVCSAMAHSVFADIGDSLLARLVLDATLLEIPAGATFLPQGSPPPTVYLLIRGFGRKV